MNDDQLYKKLFELSEDPIWLMDEEKLIKVNQAAITMLGYDSLDELDSQHPAKFSPEYQANGKKSEEVAVEMMEKAVKEGYNKFEWLHQKKNGEVFPVEVSLTKTIVENKIAFIVIWRDITERKRYELELKKAKNEALLANEKLKEQNEIMMAQARLNAMGDMSKILAHQWRQPLSSIATSLANINIDLELDGITTTELKKSIDQILIQIKALSLLIDKFSSYFTIEESEIDFNVNDLFSDMKTLLKLEMDDRLIDFINETSENQLINGYKNELIQVLLNMVMNSKEAVSLRKIKNGKIIVKAEKNKNFIILRVSDNAKGIDVGEENINKVFEPYFSTKNQLNGMGLGLYNSKMIINKHFGGDIQVKNEKLGAEFEIYIPIKKTYDLKDNKCD